MPRKARNTTKQKATRRAPRRETGAVVVSEKGRVVIPADVRRDLGLKTGDELVPVVNDGRLMLLTREQAIRDAAGMYRHLFADPKKRPSDAIRESRREEEAAE